MRTDQAIDILLRMRMAMLHALSALPMPTATDDKLTALRTMLMAQATALDMAATALRNKK